MAGTITSQYEKISDTVHKLTFTCVGDSSDGSFPEQASDEKIYGFVTRAVTNPGTPAPTAEYDITVEDEAGCDIMGGELGNRSATVSQQAKPKVGNAYDKVFVDGLLTLKITNNSVNSAAIVVILYVELPKK